MNKYKKEDYKRIIDERNDRKEAVMTIDILILEGKWTQKQ